MLILTLLLVSLGLWNVFLNPHISAPPLTTWVIGLSHLASLGLSCLICKMGTTSVIMGIKDMATEHLGQTTLEMLLHLSNQITRRKCRMPRKFLL